MIDPVDGKSPYLPLSRPVNGAYPERRREDDNMYTHIARLWPSQSKLSTRKLKSLARLAQEAAQNYSNLIETELQNELQRVAEDLRRYGIQDTQVAKAFGLISIAAQRQLNMQPREVQLMGGLAILHGHVAEMHTGEGKTLTATLPAATVALTGLPVHVITVNDYLAARDAELMRPLYTALGLTVAAVVNGMDDNECRTAYAADITYCSNQQLAFDYLRDQLAIGYDHGHLRLALEELYREQTRTAQLRLRGLCFAIVDEADSVLIDEARTPLILSRTMPFNYNKTILVTALYLARKLKAERDFRIDYRHREVQLNDTGKQWLEERAKTLSGIWKSTRQRNELIHQALSALYLFVKDRDYLVRDDKAEIIDPNTGRAMPDRAWEKELHALIELKEGLKPSGQREVLARLTYQRFFRRYIKLGGMTGTGKEVTRELRQVYRMPVVRIPTHRPSQRSNLGLRLFTNQPSKHEAIHQRVVDMLECGRPVLIGTRSVAESEKIAELFDQKDISYQLLNARQDKQEAEIIALAGQPGTVTIATNMAGRGTDIQLPQSVITSGGLHVIATEINDARRIDRQLFGRCARQGQPGSYEIIAMRDDELLQRHVTPYIRNIVSATSMLLGEKSIQYLIHSAQRREEQRQARARQQLLRYEKTLAEKLAFSGTLE